MPTTPSNALINETSPYLLQHANNPVDWQPWSDKALQEAKKKNKLIIISIGYSACHWCHVMEHESFEDSTVAKTMNKHFINIKVDREERPDIDQVYMNAVQLMTGRGGWPLNIIALPDGRPIWGGTYFPKKQWLGNLNQLADIYSQEPDKMTSYAEKLQQGMQQVSLIPKNTSENPFDTKIIKNAVSNWKKRFDSRNGGMQGAPKFMMPNNYHFLLRYAYQNKDSNLMGYVQHTLNKISYGGVYDHIGGGFSRYSTDEKWHVPHFEKMLYDNAQLVSLYADAYLITKDNWHKTVIEETLDFIKRDLTRDDGSFYSALDADSKTKEGEMEEGAYYVWKESDLKTLLGSDFNIFKDYYNINEYGYWEHDNYVLIRNKSTRTVANDNDITASQLTRKLKGWKELLMKERQKREAPGLDDKSLTSWNALMLKAYLDAYRVLGNGDYLDAALKNASFIKNTMLKEDGRLQHSFNKGKAKINGYLEDYAHTIQAFLALYETTLDEQWLQLSKNLTDYTFAHFYNEENSMFYFTSNLDAQLVTRSTEYQDNVIPASNSVMAKNLFLLSRHFSENKYDSVSQQQLKNVLPDIEKYASGYSNWLDLMLNYTQSFYELVIVGEDAKNKLSTIETSYIPNKLVAASTKETGLPLFKNRMVDGKTTIYVCQHNTCKLPVEDVQKAKDLLQD